MNKFWTVLSHTYFSKLKSKSFIITSLIVLLVMFGFSNIDHIMKWFSEDGNKEQVIVIDQTDNAYSTLEGMPENGDIDYVPFQESEEAGKKAVEEEAYAGLVVIDKDAEKTMSAVLYEGDASSFLQPEIKNELQQVKVALATEQAGVDADTLEEVYSDMSFQHIMLDESAKTEEELSGARGIVYIMLFVLYLTVLMYGQMIATEVATEKSSRVMEILISSASPMTHMFAKIIGVGLLGLTQILIFFAAGYLFMANKITNYSEEFMNIIDFSSTSTSIYIYAIVFFLLGYFLYATISAMLGSLVSRVEDVQQLLLPIVSFIMIAFFISIFGLGTPDATFITITSFIPFFTPMIMFLRIGMLDVPAWQIALSIGLLVGTIYLFAVIGARIYRGGVLMYGPSRSLKDIKQAFQLSKKE